MLLKKNNKQTILTGVSRNRAYTNAPTINSNGNTNTTVDLDIDFMNVHRISPLKLPICPDP
jgi:hypothetical protein